MQLARSYIGAGNWENAERNLKLAHEIDPDAPVVHEAFALLFQSTGEYELAEQSFDKALSLDKDFSRARNNYAAFLYQQRRFEEAEKQLEIVVLDALYESRPQAYLNLGLCRLALRKPEGAELAFTRVLAMDRTNRVAMMELAQLNYDKGKYEISNVYYQTYRGLVRQQSARALWLGIRLARTSGDRDAEGSYILALRNRYPDSPEYRAYKSADQQ